MTKCLHIFENASAWGPAGQAVGSRMERRGREERGKEEREREGDGEGREGEGGREQENTEGGNGRRKRGNDCQKKEYTCIAYGFCPSNTS